MEIDRALTLSDNLRKWAEPPYALEAQRETGDFYRAVAEVIDGLLLELKKQGSIE